ncbi:MAG: site-specific integrase [Candidatus Gastranaerophilales bacterium]|nr:site-specific integrase [Candidatus Gastranaerophilales bacterium]
MGSLRKREWKTKKGISIRYEYSYMLYGKQYKKLFKKKPIPQELVALTQTIGDNPTFQEALNDYINSYCALHCKASTIETYQNYYDVGLKPLYFLRVKTYKKIDLTKFIIQYKENHAPKTTNNLLVFLKGFFNWLIDEKIISESPAKKIRPLPIEKVEAKSLDEEDRKLFVYCLKYVPDWVQLFFLTMLNMGLRISECLALEWSDIDFDNAKMNINKQYYRFRVTSTKNYEVRIIDIPDHLLERFKSENIKSNLVFNSPEAPGQYASVNNLRERWFENIKRKMEEISNKDFSWFTPHCLRHTHATYLLSNGIPLSYVSKRLGHRDTNTTLNIYNHALPSDNLKALNLLKNLNQSKIRAKKT